MRSDTDALIYWASGVLTPSLVSVLMKAIQKAGELRIPVSALVDIQLMQNPLSFGEINEAEYCHGICEYLQLKIPPQALNTNIINGFALDQAFLDLIRRLPDHFHHWLVVDLPNDWFYPISENLNDLRIFQKENRIHLTNSGLGHDSPDLFSFLCDHVGVPKNRCLMIDANSKRAIRAINEGLPSIIFVDALRLEREFGLREFIPDPYYLRNQKYQ